MDGLTGRCQADGSRRKAMADQFATASKRRLKEKIGKLDPADLAGAGRAIKTRLALD